MALGFFGCILGIINFKVADLNQFFIVIRSVFVSVKSLLDPIQEGTDNDIISFERGKS